MRDKKMKKQENIFLSVLTPEKTVVEVQVSKVELPASKGRFVVLRDHAPVITSLEEGDVVYETAGGEERLHVLTGFAEVNENVVTVCTRI